MKLFLKMEKIEGTLAGSWFYIDSCNYLYKINKKFENKTYFMCINKLCSGTVLVQNENIVIPGTDHNHIANTNEIEILKFKQELRYLAKTTDRSYKSIFMDCEVKYADGAKATGGLRNVTSLMKRARKGAVPPVPKTLEELDGILEDSS